MRREEGVSFIIIFWVKIVGSLKKKEKLLSYIVFSQYNHDTTKWGLSTYYITDLGSGGKKRNRFLFLYSNQGNPVLRYSPRLLIWWEDGIAHPRSLWSRLKHLTFVRYPPEPLQNCSWKLYTFSSSSLTFFLIFLRILFSFKYQQTSLITSPAFTGKSTKNRTGLND